jgi:hypothetical protein
MFRGSCEVGVMNRRMLILVLGIVACANWCRAAPVRGDEKGSREIVRRARLSYYSLKKQGLLEFRCNALPDWDLTYKSVKADKIGIEQLLPILQKTRFKVVLGPDGASTISHESDVAPPDEIVAERVRDSISGMEQVLTGFYRTWSQFVVNTLLPDEDGKYIVDELDGKYRLSDNEGATDMVTTMDREFRIERIEVTSPQFNATFKTQWSNTAKGLLLAAYDAEIKTASASSVLSVKIDYDEIEGFELPSAIEAAVQVAQGKVPIRIDFAGYEVKKR